MHFIKNSTCVQNTGYQLYLSYGATADHRYQGCFPVCCLQAAVVCIPWTSLFSSDPRFCLILILDSSRFSISCNCLWASVNWMHTEKQLKLKTKYKYGPNNHHPLINRHALMYMNYLIQFHVSNSDYSFKWHLHKPPNPHFSHFLSYSSPNCHKWHNWKP